MKFRCRFSHHLGSFRLRASLQLKTEGVVGLMGPSGCGKTTLLRCIAGFEKARRGVLEVNGNTFQSDRLFVPPHQRRIGFVFQEPGLFSHLSVKENVEYGWKRTSPAERRLEIKEVVSLLGIEKFLDRNPETLSGGEKQRVAIARALLASPQLLLMDEPCSELDAESRASALDFISLALKQLSIPVIYVSHSREEIDRVADEVIPMEGGVINRKARI